jgi:putative uridylyltransferase
MGDRLEEIKKKLEKYGQEHLLMFYDKMNADEQKELLNKIENIDFKLMDNLYKNAKKTADFKKEVIEPVEYVEKSKLTSAERKMYEQKGIEAIKKGKYAVVTMAGRSRNPIRS